MSTGQRERLRAGRHESDRAQPDPRGNQRLTAMTGAILLLICLILIGLSIRSFQNGLRRAQTERVLGRLAEGQLTDVRKAVVGACERLERAAKRLLDKRHHHAGEAALKDFPVEDS